VCRGDKVGADIPTIWHPCPNLDSAALQDYIYKKRGKEITSMGDINQNP